MLHPEGGIAVVIFYPASFVSTRESRYGTHYNIKGLLKLDVQRLAADAVEFKGVDRIQAQ